MTYGDGSSSLVRTVLNFIRGSTNKLVCTDMSMAKSYYMIIKYGSESNALDIIKHSDMFSLKVSATN